MKRKNIELVAIVYGKKDLILEFLENFQMDRMHDGAELNAVLLRGNMKHEVKKFILKGDWYT